MTKCGGGPVQRTCLRRTTFSFPSSEEGRKSPPCIFHLDPVEGRHESFEGQVRRYLYRACKERYEASNEKDDMLEALACNMKYVPAKVPRQNNSYDCGVYVLHYVEVFLRESTSPGFSFLTNEVGPHFTNPSFAEEVCAKRWVILNLINELSANGQARGARQVVIQAEPQPRAVGRRSPNAQPKRLPKARPSKGHNKISKKWDDKETSILLNRLVEGGRIRKGTQGGSHWDLISEDIQTKVGIIKSADECRNRYDVLLKSYKKIKKTGKAFCDMSKKERVELNLATHLSEEWYKAIDSFQGRSSNAKSRKRAKLHNSSPSPKLVAIPGFSNLDGDLRSTLLNLIKALSMGDSLATKKSRSDHRMVFELEEVRRWLAIVQYRTLSNIGDIVLKLSELKLVNIGIKEDDDFSTEVVPYLEVPYAEIYKKFVEKVLRRNPDLDIYLQICEGYDSVSFPVDSISVSLQRIRVLSLYKCDKLEHADLSFFPELRSLVIRDCEELKVVSGWEVVKELGWLEIRNCSSYKDFPSLHCHPSLGKLCFANYVSVLEITIPVLDVSQCGGLHRLEIWGYDSGTVESIDVSTLRFFEVLVLSRFSDLTAVQGLSGLHSLTRLSVQVCDALRGIPELGCLKALTYLDLSYSGVEEIAGVQELHLLIRLNLEECNSLKVLPCLGHLKALASLDISDSGVEEIPGVENLVSLETLCCLRSRLKGLPDLHHLPRLRKVWVGLTPLSTTDPSSFYYGKDWLEFNAGEKRVDFDGDISDISDTE